MEPVKVSNYWLNQKWPPPLLDGNYFVSQKKKSSRSPRGGGGVFIVMKNQGAQSSSNNNIKQERQHHPRFMELLRDERLRREEKVLRVQYNKSHNWDSSNIGTKKTIMVPRECRLNRFYIDLYPNDRNGNDVLKTIVGPRENFEQQLEDDEEEEEEMDATNNNNKQVGKMNVFAYFDEATQEKVKNILNEPDSEDEEIEYAENLIWKKQKPLLAAHGEMSKFKFFQ